MSALPVVSPWFHAEPVTDTITRIIEPRVHEFLQANIWHVRGRDRDLVVDSGLGVASLREQVPSLFANDPILVVTHAHLDHAGSAHEFADRRAFPAEPQDAPVAASLRGPVLAELLGFDEEGAPDLLVDAAPTQDFDPDRYAIPAAPITVPVGNGSVIDLGDRRFEVLHLPGHTPDSIVVFEQATGALFSGDVLYDDELLDELNASSIPDYVRSLSRLHAVPATTVYPGHGDPFGGDRMRELIEQYLARRATA